MKQKKSLILSLITVTAVIAVISYLVVVQAKEANSTYYTVTFDSNGGTEIAPIRVIHGGLATRPTDPIKNGYTINSWKLNDKTWDFNNDVIKQDITLTAKWDIQTYSINYELEGGILPEDYPTTYTIESNFDLFRASKSGNVFTGWFTAEGERIDSIKPGMFGDLYLSAGWTSNLVTISEDETKGSINVYASTIHENEFTVKHIPVNNKHHLFNGWYDENSTLLSLDEEYSFTIDPNKVNYIYSKYIFIEEENEWNITHGVSPVLHDESTPYITYGMYPQSNVNDQELIEILETLSPTRFSGYYYYNHEYYAKRVARLARDLNTHEKLSIREFDNGDEFNENETYWFKVEPLAWKIEKQSNSEYSLISDKLLEVKKYHKNSSVRTIDDTTIYSNNYKYSDIREWLNSDFIDTAFAFNNSNLSIMEVDNSKETTATPESGFECENTFDYVTLSSYNDCKQKTSSDRQIKTTDYVRVCGANYSVNSNNLFNGYYWTRSPIATDKDNGTAVSRCNMNGALNDDFVGWGGSCVQPAIKITF